MGRGLSQLSCEIKILKNKGVKNIVIAAGYATRLGDLTKNFPKPLLKIGENTILGRMLDDIDRISKIDEHIIITNHKFASIFEDWKKNLKLRFRRKIWKKSEHWVTWKLIFRSFSNESADTGGSHL